MDELRSTTQEQEALLGRLMRRQARLSISVALGFIVILIILPLVNLYFPDIAAKSYTGFTLTWICLAILFYPLTWALSGFYVKRSDVIEDELAATETPVAPGAGDSMGAAE